MAIFNFWTISSIKWYLQTMELVFSAGKFARTMFFDYLTNEEDSQEKHTKNSKRGKRKEEKIQDNAKKNQDHQRVWAQITFKGRGKKYQYF